MVQKKAENNAFIYTYMYTHTYKYALLYICIYKHNII